MSGSTIGGVVGGIIGFFVGGPAGAQWGFMIGSAIGGYVDPVKVEGPRLKDAMQQTSQEGVPIPFGYGTFPTAGNIIWAGKLVEHKKKQRQGKGGGAQTTTYTYTRSYAIGICEGPIAGLLMVKRNGKVVWDARDDVSFTEWMYGGKYTDHQPYLFVLQWRTRAKAYFRRWINKTTVYLGDEEQLPDPTIEADEGVGKVSAFRGLAYIVVKDDDVTELQGAIPQYEFVVSASATQSPDSPTVGKMTHSVVLDSAQEAAYAQATADGWMYLASPRVVDVGATYSIGEKNVFTNGPAIDAPFANLGDGPGDVRLSPLAAGHGGWVVSEDGNFGHLELIQDGSFKANLRPSPDWPTSWFYAQSQYAPGYGALIGFDSASMFMLVRRVAGVSHNRVYRWPLADSGGEFVNATAASDVISQADPDGEFTYFHLDRFGAPWTFNTVDRLLNHMSASLNVIATYPITVPLAGFRAFAVDGNCLVIWRDEGPDSSLYFYTLSDQSLITTIRLTAPSDNDLHSENNRISMAGNSLVANSGRRLFRVEYTPECFGELPAGYTLIPDAPGYALSPNNEVVKIDCSLFMPQLVANSASVGVVVRDIAARVGLDETHIDAGDLDSCLVEGYKVATESGADGMIAALMPAFFFDAAEYDGKLHFRRRGGDATFSLSTDDLAERDEEGLTLTRVQEAELLRKVTVGHIDPMTAYTAATQTWERRAATVEAKGESAIEVPIVCSHTTAAQIAEKRGKVAWSETEKLEFALPALKWARLTPGDVGEMYLRDGNVMRIRITSLEEDSGRLLVEAARDRQAAYIGTATGVHPPPPILVDPPLIGPAQMAVMDLPVLRDADDALGLYVAIAGVLAGFQGASLELSTDGGATYSTAADMRTPATMGTVVAGIGAWRDADYPSAQTLVVRLADAPETLSREALLRYGNRLAVQTAAGWEVLQFQSVETLEDGSYALSGLVRGRYNTAPADIAAGARVVVIDDAVIFLPLQGHLLGQTVKVKAVPYGTDADATTAVDVPIPAVPKSQTEWPVHRVEWSRDGDGHMIVTWIGRARLGTDAMPRHSQYFAGYRVTISDGTTSRSFDTTDPAFRYTAAEQTTDFGSATFAPTVTVVPVNRLTGALSAGGPAADPGDLSGWTEVTGAGGWSITSGVITYDPVAGGSATGSITLNDHRPFPGTQWPLLTMNAAVDVLAAGDSFGLVRVHCYDADGSFRSVTGGTRVQAGTSSVVARPLNNLIATAGPGLQADTDGTNPVHFTNLRYSIA